MDLYRQFDGNLNIPWTLKDELSSLDVFWRDGNIFDYPQDVNYIGSIAFYKDRPARLHAAGMLLAFYGQNQDSENINKCVKCILTEYGQPSRLNYWPVEYAIKNHLDPFYDKRMVVFVIYGMALSIYN